LPKRRRIVSRKRIGVVLSGCGVQDGSEIHEAVLTLLALDRADADIVCMAPNRVQSDVVDHRTGQNRDEKRNVLSESARIARGDIKDIAEVDAKELDGVILPGGFGAAKNLSTYASDGVDCRVDPDVAELLQSVYRAGKPIAALCIAPVILAALLGKENSPQITIGTDAGTAESVRKMGARHLEADPTEVVVDRDNRLVTTPCYMSATRISQIATGTENAVKELLALSG
jgi:enhancing lycopene biosynthesis protein 2